MRTNLHDTKASVDRGKLLFLHPFTNEVQGSALVTGSATTASEAAHRMKLLWNLASGIPAGELAANRVHFVSPDAKSILKLYALAVEALDLQVEFPAGPWVTKRVDADGVPGFTVGERGDGERLPGMEPDVYAIVKDARIGEFLARLRTLVPGLALGVLALHADNERLRLTVAKNHGRKKP